MRRIPPLAVLVMALVVLALPVVPVATATATATVDGDPESAVNVSHVANLDYERRYGQSLPFGTDIELKAMTVADTVTVEGRGRGRKATRTETVTRQIDVAFAGTYQNGLQIIDVTDPVAPALLAVYDCALAQGDVQVFERDGRTYAAYTADDYSSYVRLESGCYRDNGVSAGDVQYGTFIIDVTDPRNPTSVSFVPLPRGSHNQTVHPNGRYLYNSNSDLGALDAPAIEVIDIGDLSAPALVATLPLVTGLDSHDITFSSDGSRAYSAAITHTLVIDTTDPANPAIIGRIVDPTVNISHQADPVTLTDPILGERTFLVVTDEIAGAAGNVVCPGGGLHVYDITGDLERTPLKVGFFNIPDVSATTGDSITCTSHVLRMYPEHGLMTIAWYARGVRVIDISGLVGVSVGLPGAPGMTEVGHLYFDDSDTWSAKALRIEDDGSFWFFGNDINRGLDVYRFQAAPGGVDTMDTGVSDWLLPSQVPVATSTSTTPFCLLPAVG